MAKITKLPLLTAMDVYTTIGKSLGVDKHLVEEVFDKYYEMYNYSILHKMKITLPNIGMFTLDYKERKKAGTEITSFVLEDNPKINSKNAKVRVAQKKVLTEDRPSYLRSMFVVRPKLQESIKEATKELM